MNCEKIERPQGEEEEALHLLQETAIMDSTSSFNDLSTVTTTNRFSNLHITTHPPCSTCGCIGSVTAAPSSSSVSHNHKRPSSEPALPPNPKKHNPNSPFAFSKIPLPTTTAPPSFSTLSPSQPPLHRPFSDPSDSPTTLVAAEFPQSPPQQNADVGACAGTPFSCANLPPRPPTLRRSVSDPIPSPAKTFSSSCDTEAAYESPNARFAKRMTSCFHEMTRKWDELLTTEEESGCREDTITNHNNNETNNQNNATNATMGNPEEGYVEAVAEKIGEFLSIRLTCSCGRSYQILLCGQNCFYRVC